MNWGLIAARSPPLGRIFSPSPTNDLLTSSSLLPSRVAGLQGEVCKTAKKNATPGGWKLIDAKSHKVSQSLPGHDGGPRQI